MYKLISFFIILFTLTMVPEVNASASLASLKTPGPQYQERNKKIEKVTNYLQKQNSPLTKYAPVFVDEAARWNLDYRLVVAISGVESSFGKAIPQGSYNAYGWANGAYYFQNWEDGIQTVTTTLGTKYKQKWGAETPYEIGRYYAASTTWADRVEFFMNKIEKSTPTVSQIALSL